MNNITFSRWIIILILSVILYVAYSFSKKETVNTQSANPNITVTVVSPEVKTIQKTVNATGSTVAKEEIIVTSELAGFRVSQINVQAGDHVEKGAVLAQLDNSSILNQLAQFKSEFERANDDFNRSSKLKNTGVISKASLIQKKTAMETAKARLNDAELNMKRSKITAPDAGIIFERKADIGELVTAAQPLFKIAQNGSIEFSANIPEGDLAKIKIDQSATINLTGYEKEINGKVRVVTPQVDNSKRTAEIRITMSEDLNLPVGLFGNVSISVGSLTGTSLPVTAVLDDDSENYVWKLDEQSRAVKLPVKILFRNNSGVLVEKLSSSLKIIAKAGSFVKEGEQVNPIEGQ